ncbi:thrombospondin type 1 domain protein, partial [Ancylostoma duodenale]
MLIYRRTVLTSLFLMAFRFRACATQQPCIYEWTASQWSKCSTECGHGHKTRRVICAIHEEGDITIVDEGLCGGEKPEDKTNCTNEEKCTGTWYSSPWTPCSAECGGGSQERVAVCLNYDKKPVPEWCDEATMPVLTQECNVDPCPTCFDSEFGCCPDNTTFATGDFNQGCSNCTLSEFGCCADNYTEATGKNGMGCEEFVESPLNLEEGKEEEGSGDQDAKSFECQVTNEQGEIATIECAVANATTTDVDDLFGNGTDTNATMHCSKSEFGCCPDWFTAAEGPNNAGCPVFVLGICNETEYGCCHDDVTLARGPNLEGCGEPTCAGSLYGCCKDRKTIAFGPHYAGCE